MEMLEASPSQTQIQLKNEPAKRARIAEPNSTEESSPITNEQLERASHLYEKAETARKLGRASEALRHYKEALSFNPGHTQALAGVKIYEKKQDSFPLHHPPSKSDEIPLGKIFGALIFVFGVILIGYSYSMNIGVAAGGGLNVVNLGLMNHRQNLLFTGIAGCVIGLLLALFSPTEK